MPVTPADLDALISQDLALRAHANQLRSRRPLTPISSTHVRIDNVTYVNFASNDYLGLTHHPRLIAAAHHSLQHEGIGSGAAALITGHTTTHAQAQAALARWKGTQDTVLLPSGYQANHAAIQTVAAVGKKEGGVRFLLDKLVHASMLDAVRGTGAEFRIFPHNHLGKLQRLLETAPSDQMQVVLTESIFSMDGDAADLPGLVKLKRTHPFILLLDEAHGSGVYGHNGSGYAAELNLASEVDVSIVTLSKALGGIGGAVCSSKNFCDALVNYGRAFIFSTSVPPWVAATTLEALRVLGDEPDRAKRVRQLAQRVRETLAKCGFALPPGDAPIIPIIVGEAQSALDLSRKLQEVGLIVPAVRPPTVPNGKSRLRVTLSCDHTDGEVELLLEMLKKLKPAR